MGIALRYFALPLCVIPAGAFLCAGLCIASSGEAGGDILRQQAQAVKDAMAGPLHEGANVMRDVVDPYAEDLRASPLAVFAVRSQTVGRPSSGPMPGLDLVVPRTT